MGETFPRRSRWLLAGISYALIVFANGFVLGTLRTIFLINAPNTPRLIGVLLELPFMLVGSWLVSAWLTQILTIKSNLSDRLLMGLVALITLLCAEVALGGALFNRTIVQHIALYREASYAIGLAAQIAFATFPVVQSYSKRTTT